LRPYDVATHLAEVMQTDGFTHMELSFPQLAGELLHSVRRRIRKRYMSRG
jgi:hypothetical protein